MKLYIDTASVRTAGAQIRPTVEGLSKEVGRKVASYGMRAVNELRNAELEVLKGQRTGKRYRMPHRKTYYTASAPGESPARRTGNLRLRWNGHVETEQSGGNTTVKAVLESDTKYATYLEHGTKKMAQRPIVDPITEKAAPKIIKLYQNLNI